MSACCSAFECAADQQFNEKKATEELKRYRTKGPRPTTRLLQQGLERAGSLSGTLLDIGSGIGSLTFGFLSAASPMPSPSMHRRRTLGIGTGVVAGFVLSSVAAIGQNGHYLEICAARHACRSTDWLRDTTVPTMARAESHVARVAVRAACRDPFEREHATHAQSAPPADTLAPLARMVGRWTGTLKGHPGKGPVERHYERILGSKFIQVRNRSTYPPQEKNPKGETHEDIGFFSFDRTRKRVVFRQFHVDGFVDQYVLDPSSTVDRVVFVSESIESIPPGSRARETYVFTVSDQVEEIF